MKALKNDSTIYLKTITDAIADCYGKTAEPSNAELMALYTLIGKNICIQGEKAFVVHLAEALARQLPQIKGFSPRNLRRMRDFYRTYESSPALMARALALSWTQNAVILECCETNEQRAFYLCLAAEQNLSKLALVAAIEQDTFAEESCEATAESVTAVVAPVCDCATTETVDTGDADKPPFGAFVPACEPSRQGSAAPTDTYAAVGAVASVQSRSINTKISASLYIERLTDRGKPPDKSPPHISQGKNKNAPPNGRTLHKLQNQPLCPIPIAA